MYKFVLILHDMKLKNISLVYFLSFFLIVLAFSSCSSTKIDPNDVVVPEGGNDPSNGLRVQFQTYAGTNVEAQVVRLRDTVVAPSENPTLEGSVFAGWFSDRENIIPYNFSTPVTENLTLYAKWLRGEGIVVHTVTFNTNGGARGITPIIVESGFAVTKPLDPVRLGYVFLGWFKDNSTFTEPYFFTENVTQDITLFAEWVAEETTSFSVNIIFDNGASPEERSAFFGTSIPKPEDPEREGYTFAGWYTNEAKTIPYNFFSPISQNIVIYAKWVEEGNVLYTITYHSNGGSSISSVLVEANSLVYRPTIPIRAGNIFDGWYSDNNFDNFYDFSVPVSNNLDLYAKWREEENVLAVVTLFFYEGTPTEELVVVFNNTVSQPANPTRDGFEFAGWYSDPVFSTPYNFFAPVLQDIILYARWVESGTNLYIVKFDAGNGIRMSPLFVVGESAFPKPPDPLRSGYSFDGWFNNRNVSEEYDFAQPITQDTILYAKWTKIETSDYEIIFNTGGGTFIEQQIVEMGGFVSNPSPDPTRRQDIFRGWYADPQHENIYVFSTPVDRDITLYARWEERFTVTFDATGGTSIFPLIVNSGLLVGKPSPNPTRSGYSFRGWFTDRQATRQYDFSTSINNDIILYAGWRRN